MDDAAETALLRGPASNRESGIEETELDVRSADVGEGVIGEYMQMFGYTLSPPRFPEVDGGSSNEWS